MKRIVPIAILVAGLPCSVSAAAKTASEVFDATAASMVVIRTYDEHGKVKGLGSGVVLGNEEVVTNCHVLKGAGKINVVYMKKEYPAKRLHTDAERDVCSLAVSQLRAPAAIKGSTGTLKVGSKIYVIGAPRGLDLTLSEGIISNMRPIAGKQYLQITAPISSGSSGGGLFDEEGLLVGLPTFYLNKGQQLNFAIPVDWVNELPKRDDKGVMTEQATASDWLKAAKSLEKKKDWNGLLNHALGWTRAQADDEDAWFTLGRAYNKLQQYPEAIKSYQKALEKNAGYAEAWYELGDAYNSARQYASAVDSYQKYVQIKPDSTKGWCDLGTAYGRSDQLAKEAEAYQQALRIDPGYKLAWYNLGVNYNKTKDYPKAVEAFQKALKIDADFYMAWTELGVSYVRTREDLKAIDAFQQALRTNPNHGRAWSSLGAVYSNLKQFPKAIEAFKQSLRITKNDPSVLYSLGVAYKRSGDAEEVMNVYKRLKTADPEVAEKFFKKYVLPQ